MLANQIAAPATAVFNKLTPAGEGTLKPVLGLFKVVFNK